MNPLDMFALQGVGAAYSALPTAFVIYVLLLVDARRKNSPSASDDQLGIKTVAATIAIVGTGMLALGLQGFLHVILTFDDFGPRIKAALPNLIFGGLGVIASGFVLFPRTNVEEYPKAKRLAAGVIALVAGGAMLPLLALFLERVLAWPSWGEVARALSMAVTAVVVFAGSFAILGRLSGIDMKSQGVGQGIDAQAAMGQPVAPVAAQPSYPQQPQAPAQYPPQPQAPAQYPPQPQAPAQYPPQPPTGQGWGPPSGGG